MFTFTSPLYIVACWTDRMAEKRAKDYTARVEQIC